MHRRPRMSGDALALNRARGRDAAVPPSWLDLGPEFWVRADLGITMDGPLVDRWADQSGNAHDLVAGDDSFAFDSDVLNGQPGVTPDGAGQWMAFETPWLQTPDHTILAVIRYQTSGDIQVLVHPSANGNRFFLSWSGGDVDKPAYNAVTTPVHSVAMVDDTGYVVRFSTEFAGAASEYLMQLDDGAQTVGVPAVELTGNNWSRLGIALDDSSFQLTSAVLELAIYNRKLSDEEYAVALAIAQARYGL